MDRLLRLLLLLPHDFDTSRLPCALQALHLYLVQHE
jgi:hypothetical protein